MTAQTPDYLRYQDEQYNFVGRYGSGLSDPQKLGVTKFIASTGCYRGYYCTYEVEENQLLLVELTVGQGESLSIDGISPVPDRFGDAVYKGLHIEVPFTGGILAGKDFIREHTEFPLLYPFETLLDFKFSQGKASSITDCSAQIAEIRRKFQQQWAWEAAHRDIREEIEKLQKQLSRLESSISMPYHLLTNPDDTIEAIRERLQVEATILRAKIQELEKVLYPNGHDDYLRTWLEETFSPEYIYFAF